ncbi:Oidioi.mRNA.OKI2018_I69.XSR.g14053.t1.cds [Oikopleura dioica]|uniref:Oidioi.mRNA.OKI2018_I69.XSR.g14053.t1.cds n=1 Tax=Oikopleura dioica TaxID=34765 RepID=A0ABN7SDI5_OIKDI|nr:Oidioi.mRNA.OKI2018_I69.XSR.g14053.t1.cds [Oikopleura dioica]
MEESLYCFLLARCIVVHAEDLVDATAEFDGHLASEVRNYGEINSDIITYIHRYGDVFAEELMNRGRSFKERVQPEEINGENFQERLQEECEFLDQMAINYARKMKKEAYRRLCKNAFQRSVEATEQILHDDSIEAPAENASIEERIYIRRVRNSSTSTVDLTVECHGLRVNTYEQLEIEEGGKPSGRQRRRVDDILRDVAIYFFLLCVICIPCAVFLILRNQ